MAGNSYSWWRAGEENAVAVYRKGSRGQMALLIVFCVVMWFFCWLEVLQYPFAFLIPLIFFVVLAPENRMAIIFTPTELVYRSPLGSPTRILFNGISSMNKIKVPVWHGGRSVTYVPGLLLQLFLGQSLRVRLDVPRSEEILARLQQATGKQIK